MCPARTDDYRFLPDSPRERLPGFRDFLVCTTAFAVLVDDALALKKTLLKKQTHLSWDIDDIISTGLVGIPHHFPDTAMLDRTPTELRDLFQTALSELERFDQERASLVSITKRISEGVVWGFWRTTTGSGSGLDGVEEFKVQFSATPEVPNWGTRQGYGDNTPVVKLDLQSFEQTGVTYYVGAASFAEIDSVSRVPSYPSNVSDVEWGARALQPSNSDDQFQRPLNLVRMQDIQAFVRPANNRILNSVILFITPESIEGEPSVVSLEQLTKSGRHKMTIDIGGFLQTHDDGVRRTWDQDTGLDLRPLMLIDGQHRTRGGAISPEGKDKRVPIVVLPSEMTLADVARVFTEINTGSEELAPLLQLHLRHRFYLASTQRSRDFRNWEEMDEDDASRPNCRANRLGYELAAKHACNCGPLVSRIRMMDVNSGGTNVATNAIVFQDYASSWFSPGFPFGSDEVLLGDAFAVTSAYFSAWQMVVDRDSRTGLEPWGDDINRWFPMPKPDGSSGKPSSPYITMQIPFKAVMALFPLAFELASARAGPGNPPGLDEFIEVLKPFHALDFSDLILLKAAYGTDKHTANDLYNWFSWAIQDYDARGVIYPREEVWNPSDRRMELCKPGRGFFSPANADLIQIHASLSTGSLWPETGEHIQFWSPMLPNCSKAVEWQVTVDGTDSPSIKSFCPSEGSLLEIKATQEMAQAKEIRFTVFWRRSQQNGRLEPVAQASLSMKRDDSGFISFTDGSGAPPPVPPVTKIITDDESRELEQLEEGDFVMVADFGEGPMMVPPSSNSVREPSPNVLAPAVFRRPWCSQCFHGIDHKETSTCMSYRGVYGGY